MIPPLFMENTQINEVKCHKHLGITLQNDCAWHVHINELVKKVGPMINCFRSFKYRLNRKTLDIMYKSFILPVLEYSSHIWDNCTNYQSVILENLHLDALRTICGAVRGTSHQKLYDETRFKSLKDRRRNAKLLQFFKMRNNISSSYLCNLIPDNIGQNITYNLRNQNYIEDIKCKTNL
jgi:hypothetical protein